MQELYSEPSDLDGFDELNPEDKEKVRKAFQDGHVADEDIPESAKKEGAAGEEDEDEEADKPKKKAASRKRKDTEAEGEAATEKPKRSRTTKAKVSQISLHRFAPHRSQQETDGEDKPKKTTARKKV